MTTIERNQICGTLVALQDSYGSDVKLCDLPDHEFTSGSYLGQAMARLGHTEGPRQVVNQRQWWNLTTKEVAEELIAESQSSL